MEVPWNLVVESTDLSVVHSLANVLQVLLTVSWWRIHVATATLQSNTLSTCLVKMSLLSSKRTLITGLKVAQYVVVSLYNVCCIHRLLYSFTQALELGCMVILDPHINRIVYIIAIQPSLLPFLVWNLLAIYQFNNSSCCLLPVTKACLRHLLLFSQGHFAISVGETADKLSTLMSVPDTNTSSLTLYNVFVKMPRWGTLMHSI